MKMLQKTGRLILVILTVLAAVIWMSYGRNVCAAENGGQGNQEAALAVEETVHEPEEVLNQDDVLDLTELDPAALAERLTAIVDAPEEYTGRRIRIYGLLQVYEWNGRTLCSAFVGDVTCSCGISMEFNRAGDYVYPDDYPPDGSVVYVEGTFERYEEEGVHYSWLNDAVLSSEKFEP